MTQHEPTPKARAHMKRVYNQKLDDWFDSQGVALTGLTRGEWDSLTTERKAEIHRTATAKIKR